LRALAFATAPFDVEDTEGNAGRGQAGYRPPISMDRFTASAMAWQPASFGCR
jgi:hypothetical protein